MLTRLSIISIVCAGLLVCNGRILLENENINFEETPKVVTPEVSTDSGFHDLLHSVMKAIEHSKHGSNEQLVDQERPTASEHLESLVLDLSPDKRKVLAEILGLVFEKEPNSAVHKARESNVKKPHIDKKIEVFKLPPGRVVDVQELLKHILEPTTPADLDYLKNITYDTNENQYQDDPILKKMVLNFLLDAKLNNRGFYNFA